MKLFGKQQMIRDAIFAQWSKDLPVAVMIGQRGGKTTIINSVLQDSSVSFPLVLTSAPSVYRTLIKDVAHLKVSVPRYLTTIEPGESDHDVIVMVEPWYVEGSEYLYQLAQQHTKRVLAIGNPNPNVSKNWSINALIPKYAAWETNDLFNNDTSTFIPHNA